MRWLRSVVPLAACAALIACGDGAEQPDDGAASGGMGAAGSSAGGSAGAGSGGVSAAGQGGSACPPGPPGAGTVCGASGTTCDYAGSPCGTTARCSGGTWITETSCPPADDCPAALPGDGAPCTLANPVSGSLRCEYGECPSGTLAGPEQLAECDGSTWSVTALDCAPAVDCGECPPAMSCGGRCVAGQTCGRNQCRQGEVCMRMLYQGGDWAWDCALNA